MSYWRHRSSPVVLLVVGLLALGTTFATTAAAAAGTPTTRDAKRLIAALNVAFKKNNVTFLLNHLDPAVIDRYGTDTCLEHLQKLVAQHPRITARHYGPAADYAYASDGLSATVHGVVPVTANVVIGSQSVATTVHVTGDKWFTDCGTPDNTAVAVANAGALAGHYSGTWNNNTYNTTGSLVLDIAVDKTAKVMHVTVTLGGNVFGAAAPPPETIDVPLATSTPGVFNATSKFLGPLVLTAQADNSLAADAGSVPGGVIGTMHASLAQTPTGLHGGYQLTFAGSTTTASGVVDATRS